MSEMEWACDHSGFIAASAVDALGGVYDYPIVQPCSGSEFVGFLIAFRIPFPFFALVLASWLVLLRLGEHQFRGAFLLGGILTSSPRFSFTPA